MNKYIHSGDSVEDEEPKKPAEEEAEAPGDSEPEVSEGAAKSDKPSTSGQEGASEPEVGQAPETGQEPEEGQASETAQKPEEGQASETAQEPEAGQEPSRKQAEAPQGQEESGSGSSQDTEAADELGQEDQESKEPGFFAKLFGSGEDESEGQDSQDAGKQQGKSGGTSTGSEKKQGGNSGDPLEQKRSREQSDSLPESVKYWQDTDEVSPSLERTKETLTEVIGLGTSFDVVFREMTFGGRRAALLCIGGFANDTVIDEILQRLTYLTPDNISSDAVQSFIHEYIPHGQVETSNKLSESIEKVLSGLSALFLEGETQAILMDTRSYPKRSPDEPNIERVVRGARDGFTETLLSNVSLVRRRIRDPGLKYEMHKVGRRTKTDVCVAYIDDIVDKAQVKAVTDKIKSIDIDGIPLADKQLEEAIVGAGWNPYPLVRYSERPDVVASHLLEGRVILFVDTSPSVIVLPTTFFDLCQHAEENRQTPFIGTYLRWVRFLGVFSSMFLLPLWLLLVIDPQLKPPMLEFLGPHETAKIPLLAQFLMVEIGVDLLRMAAVHTPTPLGSAMGLIAAILVGDIAVQTGLFVNEVVLYMAVAAIGMFATPSYELGLANRIVRLVLLVAVAAFHVPGFMIGTTLLIIMLTLNRSYNSSYLWPFIPFNAKAMGEIILRQPVLKSKTRPSFNKTRDNTRMSANPKDDPKS